MLCLRNVDSLWPAFPHIFMSSAYGGGIGNAGFCAIDLS